jgi:hypothetical protein
LRRVTFAELRRERGKTQYELALDMGLQQPAVSRIESRSLCELTMKALRDHARRVVGGTVYLCVVTADGEVLVLKSPEPAGPTNEDVG